MFGEFFDFLNFDRDFYRFAHLHDQNPYRVIRQDDKVILIHNCLGVDSKDIEVKVEQNGDNSYLTINGKTHEDIEDTDYTISSRFSFDESKFEKISYGSRNGLLYIILIKKQPTKSQITIEKE